MGYVTRTLWQSLLACLYPKMKNRRVCCSVLQCIAVCCSVLQMPSPIGHFLQSTHELLWGSFARSNVYGPLSLFLLLARSLTIVLLARAISLSFSLSFSSSPSFFRSLHTNYYGALLREIMYTGKAWCVCLFRITIHMCACLFRITIHICAMTHSYVWHDSPYIICVTWRIHMRTPIYPICIIVDMCDMTHSHVTYDSFIYVTWFIHMCAMTHSYVWHEANICWITVPVLHCQQNSGATTLLPNTLPPAKTHHASATNSRILVFVVERSDQVTSNHPIPCKNTHSTCISHDV